MQEWTVPLVAAEVNLRGVSVFVSEFVSYLYLYLYLYLNLYLAEIDNLFKKRVIKIEFPLNICGQI